MEAEMHHWLLKLSKTDGDKLYQELNKNLNFNDLQTWRK